MTALWPGAKVAQVLPLTESGTATKAGVAVARRPGLEVLVLNRWEIKDTEGRGLIQAVHIKLDVATQIVGIYVSPQTGEEMLEKALEQLRGSDGTRNIFVGDFNARHIGQEDKRER